MSFIVSLTGSYPPVRLPPPPLKEEEVAKSIRDAIAQQKDSVCKAPMGAAPIEWLFVDGQPRSDIVGIFAPGLGLEGEGLPYRVTEEIEYKGPITLRDLEIAAQAAEGVPLKAHITGPTLMAESCTLTSEAPSRYVDDPEKPRQLTLDLAHALAQEVEALVATAPELRITHLQIDETTLAYGADLALAREGVGIVAQVARDAGIPVLLHVCWDISAIMEDLLAMDVDILNVEGEYLREMPGLNAMRLTKSGKKLAIGCIPVDQDEIPSVRWLQRELLFAAERFGVDNIWGITPYCGLRMSDPDLARRRLDRLVEAACAIAPRFEALGSGR